MAYIALNNAYSTLASGISNSATTITVQSGHGSRFAVGSDYTYLVLENTSGTIEIVKCTARSGDSLTVVRGQDGTAAVSWNTGDIIECRPCSAAMNEFGVAAQTIAASSKSTPVDADKFGIIDSAAGNVLKYFTWANFKSFFTLGAASSVDSEVALFSGTDGKTLKRASGSGVAVLTSGVLSTVTAPSGTIVGTTDTQTLSGKTITGLKETKVALAASDIDCSLGNHFTKTISGTTTFTVSNVPATGTTATFILDLTNGGSATINWWSGVKWPGGSAPTLTTAGRDVLGFFTHDGGTVWTGLVLGKDVK